MLRINAARRARRGAFGRGALSAPPPAPTLQKGWSAHLIRLIGLLPAVALMTMMLLTFISVLMRYLFNSPIPDSYEFSRLLLGVVVMWGIALAAINGEHVVMSIPQAWFGRLGNQVIKVVSSVISLGFFGLLAWMLWQNIGATIGAEVVTADLRISIWPFYLAAWVGVLLAFAGIILAGFVLPGSQAKDGAPQIQDGDDRNER